MTNSEAKEIIIKERDSLKANPIVKVEDCLYEAYDVATKALEQTRWIPVSERLPESDEECHTFLVTDINGNVTLSDFYLSLSNSEPYWSGMIDVIAWMSLPHPYKAESEE